MQWRGDLYRVPRLDKTRLLDHRLRFRVGRSDTACTRTRALRLGGGSLGVDQIVHRLDDGVGKVLPELWAFADEDLRC